MSGDVWEHLVGTYLTRDRGVFVSPAYLLGEPGQWESSLDFLALDIREQQVWAVEITSGRDLTAVRTKARKFDSDYAPRIRHQLNHDGFRMVELLGWSFGLWAFVRADFKERLEKDLTRDVTTWRATALEDAVFDWAYWDSRYKPVPPFQT